MKEDQHAVLESEVGGLMCFVWVVFLLDVSEEESSVVDSELMFRW